MIEKKVFEVKARRDIYTFILKNPGLHFREIGRSINMPRSTVEYHLNYLKKRGFIITEVAKGYQRYFVSKKIGEYDKKLFNILRQTVPRNIILYLSMFPDSSQSEMKAFGKRWKRHPSKIGYHLNKHHTTLNFHLQKLVGSNIVETFKFGNEVKYRLRNPEDFTDILITYNQSLLADAFGHFFKWFEAMPPDYIDKVMSRIYRVFPHPYRI
jgi:predicted transcriptional regulator